MGDGGCCVYISIFVRTRGCVVCVCGVYVCVWVGGGGGGGRKKENRKSDQTRLLSVVTS